MTRFRCVPSASPTRSPAVLVAAGAAAAAAAAPALAHPSATAAAAGEGGRAPVCAAAAPAEGTATSGGVDPNRVEMAATRRARGGSGVMTIRLGSSPAGVALTEDGSYRYDVKVSVEDLPPLAGGTYVVWAATPDLDRHRKLGTVDRNGSVEGDVAWNKFLLFVTAESSADVESWSQSIVLSARSPSGRMHTMAGHGPFSGEPCLDPRP